MIDMFTSVTTIVSFDNYIEKVEADEFEKAHPDWIKTMDTMCTYFKNVVNAFSTVTSEERIIGNE